MTCTRKNTLIINTNIEINKEKKTYTSRITSIPNIKWNRNTKQREDRQLIKKKKGFAGKIHNIL